MSRVSSWTPRSDGREGLDLALSHDYDCLVLDVMLPGLTGLEVLTRDPAGGQDDAGDFPDGPRRGGGPGAAASNWGQTTTSSSPSPSPSSWRVSALSCDVRPAILPEVTTVADLTVDHGRRKAFRGGPPFDLTPKEFALLALLARRPGSVLSRSQ